MQTDRLTIEVKVPDGYELTGEYRLPLEFEVYLAGYTSYSNNTEAIVAQRDLQTGRFPILRKAQVWKQLTPAKAVEFMQSGMRVTLRHRSGTSTTSQRIESIFLYNNRPSIKQDDMNNFIDNISYLEE